jgi:hypothetical protein
VVADTAGRVAGAATLDIDSVPDTGGPSGATGFVAIARKGSSTYTAYAVFEDSSTPVVVGSVGAADIAPARSGLDPADVDPAAEPGEG